MALSRIDLSFHDYNGYLSRFSYGSPGRIALVYAYNFVDTFIKIRLIINRATFQFIALLLVGSSADQVLITRINFR